MKICLLVLLTFMVFAAAFPASASDDLQHVILAEIIQGVNELNASLTTEISVQKVITTKCTYMNFCKAGNILSEFNAEQFGLKDEDWLLPRRLVAYSRHVNCKVSASEDRIDLRQLLDNIHQCAQKQYSQSFIVSTQTPFT